MAASSGWVWIKCLPRTGMPGMLASSASPVSGRNSSNGLPTPTCAVSAPAA